MPSIGVESVPHWAAESLLSLMYPASPQSERPPSAKGSARKPKRHKKKEQPGEPRPESACSARSATSLASSASSSMSSVHFTPRPHCWVDDITVSSDESADERHASLATPDPDRQPSLASEEPPEGGAGGKGSGGAVVGGGGGGNGARAGRRAPEGAGSGPR